MRNKRGRSALALLLAVTMIGAGCATDWVHEAREIIAVLMPATTNLVILVATVRGQEISAEDLAAVQNAGAEVRGDLNVIQDLIGAYDSADQKAKPGILTQIQSAIQAAQENLEGLTQGLHIKDRTTQAKVTAVLGILLAEVQSLAAILPVVQRQGRGISGQGAEARSRGAGVRPKKPLSASAFVKSYNATMRASTGRAELDRVSVGLQLDGTR